MTTVLEGPAEMTREEVEASIIRRLEKLKEEHTDDDIDDLREVINAYMLFVEQDPRAPERIPVQIHNESASVNGNGKSAGFILGGLLVGLVIAILIIVIVHLVSQLHAMGRDPFEFVVSVQRETPFRDDIKQIRKEHLTADEDRDAIVRRTVIGAPAGTEARRQLDADTRRLTIPPNGVVPEETRAEMEAYHRAMQKLDQWRKGQK